MSGSDEDNYEDFDEEMEHRHSQTSGNKQRAAAAIPKNLSEYAEEIREVIVKHNENPSELSTFSVGGEVEPTLGVPAVHVDGVGRLAYPLCKEQTVTLLGVSSQAPFGKGKKTVVDTNIRRAWQVDSKLVHINPLWLSNALPKLVTDCCAKLGIDAVKANVRANLYKLLLYEEGGHFKKHRDTEKEPGMFGSLLVQLPADHEGGHLVVQHDTQKKRYQFDKESADKAYYAAFYADCEHTLEPVTKGLRLVLAFNLVRGVANPASGRPPATAAHRRGFEDTLYAAAKAWCNDLSAVKKLALPLAHQYTHTNVSFDGLKGTDLSALNLLRNVRDPQTNKRVFRVYLALVTKHETGTEEEDDYGYDSRYRGRYGGGGGGMSADCDVDVAYETENWVGPKGPVDFGELSVDFDEELLTAPGEEIDEATEQMFGSDPDDEEREGYCGNYAGSVEYWYHSAVLVFWPAEKDFDIKLAANPTQAVTLLQSLDRTSPNFAHKLTRLLAFLSSGATKAWRPADVLPLCQTVEQVRTVLGLCQKLTLSEADATAVSTEVMKHGWIPLQENVTQLLKSQSPSVMTLLLGFLYQHCHPLGPAFPPAEAPFYVPQEAWEALLFVLATKVCQSNPGPAPSAYSYPYYGSTSSSSTAAAMTDADCLKVSRFVIKHCVHNDQVSVAGHLGSKRTLSSLNSLLQQLQSAMGEGVVDGPFQAELRSCAVQQCVDKAQSAGDMTAVVDGVVRGQHADLLTKLHATLKRLCKDPALFRAIFNLPSVRGELKKETAMSAELESLVQSRIAAVAPNCIAPPFSWRMPANQIASATLRVVQFLTSDQQSVTLTGEWSGIVELRRWIGSAFGYGSRGQQSVTAGAPFGIGRKAGVTLTKNKTAHDAVVKRCAENANELQTLRKLLRVRGASASAVSGVEGGQAGSGGSSAEGSSEAPPAKKARVEPEIIVIDD
eukprot:gene19187-21823_t